MLHNGLEKMVDYEEEDLESVFMQTFRVCYTDVFGSVLHHDLKPNGDSIFVTQENKKVGVNGWITSHTLLKLILELEARTPNKFSKCS